MARLQSHQRRVFAQDLAAWGDAIERQLGEYGYISGFELVELSVDPLVATEYVNDIIWYVADEFQKNVGTEPKVIPFGNN